MNAIVFDFEDLKAEHRRQYQAKKEQMIFECQQDILDTEEQIQSLAQQITALQTEIDLNYKLIDKISRS